MKSLKTLTLLLFVLSFSFTSCEDKEETNEPLISVEDEAKEFEKSLKSDIDPRAPSENNCSFGGVINAEVRSGHFVGVNEFPFLFGDDAKVTWTIDGNVVTPLRPRFVRVNDHISQAGQLEVCYRVTSLSCGTLGACVVIDFEG
ncbi:hypothetical protein NBT05_09175 [Aquimarina sp. ERC-38]|uniref:hypothetical protein n=1 Tax=Aquimarina sp. ERC-38 TaxID=2949996 RepID=UPI00224806B3|nr:hypothetical protein [Aquimarina sp. ERC-38]UZO79142.1 hypothetical protein NBT05_09175 [Aquimarina sp. ERC-38]